MPTYSPKPGDITHAWHVIDATDVVLGRLATHAATLLREPRIRSAIERLAGQIREADMRSMNYAVEEEKRDPAVVVRSFLDARAAASGS